MDLLNSPLNLAHQQSRKADRHMRAGRYEEAIKCHQNAADRLGEAMSMTTVQQALESLSLQRESHLRQQALIQDKMHTSCAQQDRIKGAAAGTSVGQSSPSDLQQGSESPTPCERYLNKHGVRTGSDPEGRDFSGDVMRTMEQCDSLLLFLDKRARSIGTVVHQPSRPSGTTTTTTATTTTKHSDNPSNDTGDSGPIEGQLGEGKKKTKQMTSDAVIVEELQMHNEALRYHVLDLLKETEDNQRQVEYTRRELDYVRSENRRLRDRIQSLENHSDTTQSMASRNSETFYSFPVGMALNLDNLPSLELPPLEIPKFDCTILKSLDSKPDSKQGDGSS